MKGSDMQIDICSLNFDLTAAIASHAKQRVETATRQSSKMLAGVMVRMWDVNAQRGGVDKACRIVVWLPRRSTLVVEAVDSDLYVAIDIAAARLKRALHRHVRRRQTLRREHAHNPHSEPLKRVHGKGVSHDPQDQPDGETAGDFGSRF
jgi:ribosomal subunit interface protein